MDFHFLMPSWPSSRPTPLGTRPRLAYALLFYTGQRSGDVVRIRRADISGGAIKPGVELSIQIHPDLAEAIKAGPTKGRL